jgi:hypothetical protein
VIEIARPNALVRPIPDPVELVLTEHRENLSGFLRRESGGPQEEALVLNVSVTSRDVAVAV